MENQDAAMQAKEEEIEGTVKRSMAYSILPAVISTHVWDTDKHLIPVDAELIVQKAYAIADQMLKQGDKL